MTLSAFFRPMLAMAAIAISTSAVASAQFKFVNISISGSKSTWALGISNKNEIVGYYETGSTASPVYHGFWRTNAHPAVLKHPIDDPSASGFTQLTSIDSSDLVVGAYEPAGVQEYGLLLVGSSFYSYFVPGYLTTYAEGINDNGLVVGRCLGGHGDFAAWTYTSRAGYHAFLPPNASSAFAFGVDTAGDVVGGYNDTESNLVHGFLRDTSNNFTTIDFPGANLTYATGISDTGVIAGTFFDDIGYHGFLLQGGVYTEIDVPGQFNTQLGQLNKNGWFVGNYENKHGKAFAFYAKPSPGASVLVDSDDEE